jgi:hypothetical protein
MASKKRGGQLSNTNSLKHGFYSKKLDADLLPQLAEAAQVEGLDQEISILRLKLRTLVNGKSTQEAALALDCANTLAKLIKTRYTISIDHNETLKNAIALVLTEIAAPLKIKKLLQ